MTHQTQNAVNPSLEKVHGVFSYKRQWLLKTYRPPLVPLWSRRGRFEEYVVMFFPEDGLISLIVSGCGALRGVLRKNSPNSRTATRNMNGISASVNDRAGAIWAVQVCVPAEPSCTCCLPTEHWPQWDEEWPCPGGREPDVVFWLLQSTFPGMCTTSLQIEC